MSSKYHYVVGKDGKKHRVYNKRQNRRPKYVKGRGKYKLPERKGGFDAEIIGGTLGGAGGAAIGNLLAPGIGMGMGEMLGKHGGEALGRLFRKITGYGDYQVKSNTLVYDNEIVPSFGDDSIRVKKREFIAQIDSASALTFSLQNFPINPGLDTSFPWLSSIAKNYEQYRINGMIFQFVSTSSDAIASTTALGLGQVILATDYNAADDNFIDAAQMLNYMFSNSGKPSEHILHAIECSPTDTPQKLYYVRTGRVFPGQDPRLYDLGNFQIATNNMPAAYNGMGQLWVSYDVTFCKSIANNQLGFSLNTDQFQLTTGLTNANPFGTGNTAVGTWSALAGSNLGCTLDANNIYFPQTLVSGFYMVTINWKGTATAITNPAYTPTNCKAVQCWTTTTLKKITGPADSETASMCLNVFIVKLGTADSSTQCAIGCAAGVLPTTLTRCEVLIQQVNGDIYDLFALASGAF